MNLGWARSTAHSDTGTTGIDKQPVDGPVEIREPGPRGTGGSGLAGDAISDLRHHGGTMQAVHVYAREDLDFWEAELGRPLRSGMFGENLTVRGLDVTGALIGERWQVGASCVLQVTSPRIPCRTFAGWLQDQGWIRRFTEHGAPGAYLRVVAPGQVRAGDPVAVVHRPDHQVSVGLAFQALTTDKPLLPHLLAAGHDLPEETRARVLRWEQRAD